MHVNYYLLKKYINASYMFCNNNKLKSFKLLSNIIRLKIYTVFIIFNKMGLPIYYKKNNLYKMPFNSK